MGDSENGARRPRRVNSPNRFLKMKEPTSIPNLTELTYRIITEQLLDCTPSERTA
jgi:hypothetical protein